MSKPVQITIIPAWAAVMRRVWSRKNKSQVIGDPRNSVFYGVTAKANFAIVDTGNSRNSAFVVASRPEDWDSVDSVDTALDTMQFGREGFYGVCLSYAVKLSTLDIDNARTIAFAICLSKSPSLKSRADNVNRKYLKQLPEVHELRSAGLELIERHIGVNLVALANAEHRIIDLHIPLPPPKPKTSIPPQFSTIIESDYLSQSGPILYARLHQQALQTLKKRPYLSHSFDSVICLQKEVSKGEDGRSVFGRPAHLPYSIPYLISIGFACYASGYRTKLSLYLSETGEGELRIQHIYSSRCDYTWATTILDVRDVGTSGNLWCHGMEDSTTNAKSEPITYGYAEIGLHLSGIDMKDIPAYGVDIHVTKVRHAVDLRELKRMAMNKVQGFRKLTEEIDLLFMRPDIPFRILYGSAVLLEVCRYEP
ncbi:hypothetical protein PGQ11_002663 [Apiospora arundinis]|uniref:Uncharacterized protein n=1 Tax=Apiospora arundinis TaxID=335852 RepID=A0ABR2JKB9_9PEZI